MTEDINKKTKSGLYWNLSLKIPYEIFRFGISIFVARLLDPNDFGIVSIATMLIYYSNSITNFGFKRALVQNKYITSKHINSVFTVDLVISVFFAGLFFLISHNIAVYFKSPECENVIKVLSVVFIITTFYDLPYALLIRDINFKFTSIIDMANEVSMSIITLVLAILGYRYWSIVFGRLLPLCVSTVYIIYKVQWKPRFEYSHSSIKELFDFGLWSFIRHQVIFISSRIDRIIIGKMLNTSSLGFYEKAKAFYQMPIDGIALNMNSVLFSSFNRIQDNLIQIKNIFSKSLTMLSIINFPIYFGLYVLSDHLVLVLLGNKWANMIIPLRYLCISGIFMTFTELISSVSTSIGLYKKYTYRLILSTIFLIIICLSLVRYGIGAVAAGIPLFSLLLLCLSYELVKNKINMSWREFFFSIFPALVSAVVMLITLKLILIGYFREYTGLNTILLILIGAVVYILSIAVFPSKILNELKGSLYNDWGNVIHKYIC